MKLEIHDFKKTFVKYVPEGNIFFNIRTGQIYLKIKDLIDTEGLLINAIEISKSKLLYVNRDLNDTVITIKNVIVLDVFAKDLTESVNKYLQAVGQTTLLGQTTSETKDKPF
tara:strand:- start:1562 stop:1897 length:336 start_codon:yes stop_codon:yes gene_type:complete